MWPYLLLGAQLLLLGYFCFFAVYKYFYAFSSLRKVDLPTTKPSGKKVAVVIVSYNEKEVIKDTIEACEELSYENKVIIVGDDSNDKETYALLSNMVKGMAICCKRYW